MNKYQKCSICKKPLILSEVESIGGNQLSFKEIQGPKVCPKRRLWCTGKCESKLIRKYFR